jgi:hypothetical protein
MLKTISAALLAVSVLAAPALAATPAKNNVKTTQAPVIKAGQVKAKPSALNANAKMGSHHRHYRHHRSHKHMGAIKAHQFPKVTVKHVTSVTKRG